MQKRHIMTGIVLAITTMMVFSAITVMAAPPLPFVRQGTAYIDSVAAGDNIAISAWCDGVRYVENVTYNGDGSYKLVVPGDDPTITTQKDGANDNELVVYWMNDGSNWYIANEVDNWVSDGDVLGDLNFATTGQPYMAKLYELVPAPATGNDFLWIAAPSSWDPTDYSLENDNGWSMTLAGNAVYRGTTGFSAWYVDLGGDVLGAADEMKLVWTDPAATKAAGNPVVIDRVEYGGQTVEPDNTIMPDATAPGADQGIQRIGGVATPQDTEDCSADFAVVAADYPWNPQPVYNLWVEKDTATGDAILHWDDANSPPGGYNVYESTDPLAAWPWTALATGVSGLTYTHVGAVSDASNHFYIVRATDGTNEGGNSSMAFVAKVSLTYIDSLTVKNWVSVPYSANDWNGDGQTTASDIVASIEGGDGVTSGSTYISKVAKWDASVQGYSTTDQYYYTTFPSTGWYGGTDFTVSPGDSVAIEIKQSFTWVVNATDKDSTYGLTYIDSLTVKNWISAPYTIKDYNGDGQITASDIVASIEGGDGVTSPSTYISKVAKWDASVQGYSTTDQYYYTTFPSTGWYGGTDFTVSPGDSVAIEIKQSFTWSVSIITPEVVV